jgi:hypothetical protein
VGRLDLRVYLGFLLLLPKLVRPVISVWLGGRRFREHIVDSLGDLRLVMREESA